MAETSLDITRTWIEFADPAEVIEGEPPDTIVRADLTWLTSSWMCIFGQGCPGPWEGARDAGCCTLGAHFSEKADKRRVKTWVKKLTPQMWQRFDSGQKENGGWTERDEDGELKTRVIDGACIFANDPDFEGGYGCALHHLAKTEGVSHVQTKPDVCWQLPIRRTYRTVKRPDGTKYLEVTIGEYDRRGWGAGGHDMDWYCTGSPLAHVGSKPVFEYAETELRELIGDEAYEVLATHCQQAMPRRRPLPLIVHPATTRARDHD